MIAWNYCPQCAKPMTSGNDNCPSCPDGHFTKYKTPVASTLAFIQNDDKYLVLRRAGNPKKGYWDLPGGFAIYDESAEQTITREMFEETGITDLHDLRIIGTFPGMYGDIEKVLTVGYVAKTNVSDVRLSAENNEFQWVGLDDMPELAFEDCQQALALLKQQVEA